MAEMAQLHKGEKVMKKYIAYGSNLNLQQMSMRCPTAKVVGTALLNDWQLTFRHVATIVPEEGAVTPVGVWDIDERAEKALDRYEGYPNLYGKHSIEVECNGQLMECMVYTMNEGKPKLPPMRYFATIQQGYADVGLDESHLIKAIEDTEKRMK